METDTHAALLAELPNGSKPPITITSHPIGAMYKHHVQDSIELSAWWRVRAWCEEHGSPTVIRGCQICYYSDGMLVEIGTGPDDATALLAACRFINEQEKR